MAKKKPKPKKKPVELDAAQKALAGVEKLIGGKLSDGISKKHR